MGLERGGLFLSLTNDFLLNSYVVFLILSSDCLFTLSCGGLEVRLRSGKSLGPTRDMEVLTYFFLLASILGRRENETFGGEPEPETGEE